jgi:hypothetical protein
MKLSRKPRKPQKMQSINDCGLSHKKKREVYSRRGELRAIAVDKGTLIPCIVGGSHTLNGIFTNRRQQVQQSEDYHGSCRVFDYLIPEQVVKAALLDRRH